LAVAPIEAHITRYNDYCQAKFRVFAWASEVLHLQSFAAPA
jgi:hypothetical protein